MTSWPRAGDVSDGSIGVGRLHTRCHIGNQETKVVISQIDTSASHGTRNEARLIARVRLGAGFEVLEVPVQTLNQLRWSDLDEALVNQLVGVEQWNDDTKETGVGNRAWDSVREGLSKTKQLVCCLISCGTGSALTAKMEVM